MLITERARPGATPGEYDADPPGVTRPARDTEPPRGRIGCSDRVAVVVPVTGPITLVAMSTDVVELARREIGCTHVERLRLGRALIPTGAQMWVGEQGPLTGQPPNPRASALVRANSHSPRLARQPFTGTAVFTGPDDPTGQHTRGLRTAEALRLLLCAARAHTRAHSGGRAPRAANHTRRGPS